MILVRLERNNGFAWYSHDNAHVKGYIFDKEGVLLKNQQLIDYFKDVKDVKTFSKLLIKSNGIFSVIIQQKDRLLAATDISRQFPLFYTFNGSDFVISDLPEVLFDSISDVKLNNSATSEYLATGFISGNNTLINNLFQIQTCEIIEFSNNTIKSDLYFHYSTDSSINISTLKLEGLVQENLDEAFKRMVKSLEGRQAVVPLSGGFDSRLIAVMLKKMGHENVLCFTYGSINNPEIKISEKVAEILNFKWIFIDYNQSEMYNYLESDIFKYYYQYAANLSSMPFMSEYFAVKYLHENKIIDNNAIFIPGHGGDFIGGSQITRFKINKKESQSGIVNKLYDNIFIFSNIRLEEKKSIKTKLKGQITSLFIKDSLPYSVFEDWDSKEKLTKFIANSARVFSYFGYEIRLPYWDILLIRFFKKIPYNQKIHKKLYNTVLSEFFFGPYNLNFNKELQPSKFTTHKQWIKGYIKKIIPSKYIYKFQKTHDNFNYNLITAKMVKEMEDNGLEVYKSHKYGNAYIVQWYVFKIKQLTK